MLLARIKKKYSLHMQMVNHPQGMLHANIYAGATLTHIEKLARRYDPRWDLSKESFTG